jgi:serine/threonine-protein kinase
LPSRLDNLDTTRLDPQASPPRAPNDPLHQLRSIGEYRILRPLGEGGMGFVYLGYHEQQGRHVAIKVLGDHLASNQSFVERFYREARSGSQLNHPNIVRSLSVAQDRESGKHFLVLEYVDGPNAHALLERQGRLSVADAVHVALDIARALEHAHSRNIVHRDIKPDNILITRTGVAKLADMGLAKRTDEASHLTAARQGFGTPHYMPYEQAVNAKYVDGRSDIYALGATLYHLVTGEVPFSGANHLEVVEKKGLGVFFPASAVNPDVPSLLDEVLEKMMAREPRDRYQTASELIIDLERSRLASPVLSFIDPEMALQDPAARSYLARSMEPTRPDLAGPTNEAAALRPQPEVWYLRYRGQDGTWRTVRATAEQIVRRLREGRVPAGVEASRQADGAFVPLASVPEFRAALPRRRSGVKRTPASPKDVPIAEPVSPPPVPGRWGWLLLGTGAGLAVLSAAAVIIYKLFLAGT